MHTGYYEDNSKLDFCPLENEFLTKFSVKNGDEFDFTFSANDMLHGFCDIFAEVLAKKFNPNYQVYSLLDPSDGYLTHCYCMLSDSDKKYYIDVRGITDNFNEFISEFADFVDTKDEQELSNAGLIVPYNFNMAEHNRDYMQGTNFEKKIVELSKQIISHQEEFYNPSSIKKELVQSEDIER